MKISKNKFGLLHSIDDQPSIIDDNGNKYWYINGVPSRLDISLPYIEKSDGYKEYRLENGGKIIITLLKEEWYDKNNNWHRENGPARILYYGNGNLKYEYYYQNGGNHREDGPANIKYYENGSIECKVYYLNGEIHRENSPAIISYYENGNIKSEHYYNKNLYIEDKSIHRR
jgi:antitoxin component YwqK of YwqJK toxin-antitoxin module